jgi:hypothetical protein
VGGAGWFLGGPLGALIGGAAGFVKFLADKEEGYYDAHNPKSNKPIITGKFNTRNTDTYRS